MISEEEDIATDPLNVTGRQQLNHMRARLEDNRNISRIVPGMDEVPGRVALVRMGVNIIVTVPAKTYKVRHAIGYITIRCPAHAFDSTMVHVCGGREAAQAGITIP